MSKTTTFARMRRDGVLVRIRSDGTEEAIPIPPPQATTSEKVEQAACADPDARPFTPAERATVKRVPRIKTLRRALGLTQEDFAAHYRIPLGTLPDWEQFGARPARPRLPHRYRLRPGKHSAGTGE